MKTNFNFTYAFALLMAALLFALPIQASGRGIPICTDSASTCQPFPPAT
jgi:hypothetical protein